MSDEQAMPPPDAVQGDVIDPAGAALVPIQQQQVDFYGDPITGVLIAREGRPPEWYVPLRPITAFLGLDWGGQRVRTNSDEVLGPSLISVEIISTEKRGRGRGRRTLLCLPLRYLPGWLFGLNPGKMKSEIAAKITLYRAECFDILWRAFAPQIVPGGPPVPTAPLTGAALALEIATAVQHLARQQVEMEARLGQVAGRQTVMADYMRGFVTDTRHRLTALEVHLGTGPTISEAQAAEIMLAVKAVGGQLDSRGDQAGYQKVYSELYRREGIATYRNLPTARYKEVIAWLQAWYHEIAPPAGGGQTAGSTEC